MKIIATDSIKTKANDVKECIDFMSERVKDLNLGIGLINTFWQGADASSFVKKYDEALIKLREYQTTFENYYDYLLKIYDIFEAFEDTYNKKIDIS